MNSLLPEKNGDTSNGRFEQRIDIAMLETAITECLDLYLDIDNQTNHNCLMAWVNENTNGGGVFSVDAGDMRTVITNLYKRVGGLHAKITAASHRRKA